ncbi:hypothetical protein NLI96_g10049 [Meripilus lineatus]|uniref:C-factor n=1 Tax=Meripilus lineatus TaxID=2056292 RepID=A0AAD5UYU4_9APHY|nr:hypothetical protein NLI96_g10049 [Physisporinus lineatus]
MSELSSWLITGCSRGIGLEFVRQLIASPSNLVIATCRNPDTATALQALRADTNNLKGTLHIARIDVADEQSIRGSVKELGLILEDHGLDYLINNAAVTEGADSAFKHSAEGFRKTFEANVIGPALLAQVYLPYLEKGRRKVIMNMTSGLASMGLNIGSKNATYSVSKTALNMLTYKQATERPDLIAFVVDPGWVKTVMGGEGAFLEPHESVESLIQLLTSVTSEHSGKFFGRDGNVIPW